MVDHSVSKKTFDKLTEELRYLKTVKRKAIAKAVSDAKEQGDLRENAGYHEARKEFSINEAKIEELEAKLKHAEVTEEEEEKSTDFVALGSKGKYKNLDTGDEGEYTIVSDLEADISQRKISSSTPLGKKFIGSDKGATIEVSTIYGEPVYCKYFSCFKR
ncbi:MAG: transcription elongation factor GreA [Candidatus Saganbacteria bacterium]|nr:transcription elongation factor GreA [Candidatus Saganbacteria bacterium]